MRIYLIRSEEVIARRHEFCDFMREHLVLCHQKSSSPRHELVQSSQEADLVFLPVQGLGYGAFFQSARSHPLILKNREKLVVCCSDDNQFPVMRGLYTQIEKKWVDLGWALPMHYLSTHIHRFHFQREELGHKDILCSFVGSSRTALVRKLILEKCRREDIYLHDSSSSTEPYWWNKDNAGDLRQLFRDTLVRSQFVLCPRGASASSIRLFEVMEAGAVPVIVSDTIQLPIGPKWADFCLFVKEAEVENIPAILDSAKGDARAKGTMARQVWEEYFSDEVAFNHLVDWGNWVLENSNPVSWEALHDEYLSVSNLNIRLRNNLRNWKRKWRS